MRDTRIEGVLSSLKIKFDYEAEYPLAKLVSDPATQVRLQDNQGPKKEVDRYRDLLKAGAEFPPICTLKDGRIVDGNTRWGAFDALHRTVIPAYVCQIDSPQLAKRVGVELNSVHGKRMEKTELVNWIAANGIDPDDITRITGWSRSTVSRTRDALKFDERRRALGVTVNSALPENVRAALVKVTDPECFSDMTRLADDAGLKPAEIRTLTAKVNEAALTDPAEARRIISDFRAESGPRIEEHHAGLRVTTPLYQQLAMHTGWLIKQGATGLHDTNEWTGPKSQALLEELGDVVAAALQQYA